MQIAKKAHTWLIMFIIIRSKFLVCLTWYKDISIVHFQGDTCPFRHEPSARGTEEMCEEWAHGKCVDESCSLRHMQINVRIT